MGKLRKKEQRVNYYEWARNRMQTLTLVPSTVQALCHQHANHLLAPIRPKQLPRFGKQVAVDALWAVSPGQRRSLKEDGPTTQIVTLFR
jgi:hypothetical protein